MAGLRDATIGAVELDDAVEVQERTRSSAAASDVTATVAAPTTIGRGIGRRIAASPAVALQLQRTAGNAAVGRLLRRDPLDEDGEPTDTATESTTTTTRDASTSGAGVTPPPDGTGADAPDGGVDVLPGGIADDGAGTDGRAGAPEGSAPTGGGDAGAPTGDGGRGIGDGASGSGPGREAGPEGDHGTRVEAPTPPTPTSPTTPPTPADPTPFQQAIADPVNTARAILEVTRPIPVVGLFTGLVADGINAKQDLDAFDGADAPYTKTTVGIRNAVNIINNGIGAIAQITQLAEDAATGSVVGAELDVALVPFHEAVKGVKIFVDGVLISLDALVGAEATWNLQHTNPTDTAGINRWNGVIGNYLGNIMSDGVTLTLDMIDEATGGFSNGETVKRVATAAENAWKLITYLRNVVLGWWGVYGGSVLTPSSAPTPAGGAAPAAARSVDRATDPMAGPIRREGDATTGGMSDALRDTTLQIILGDISSFRSVYAQADRMVKSAPDTVNQLYAQADAWVAELTGGAPLTERIHQITADTTTRITEAMNSLTTMGAMGTTAGEKAAWINEQATSVLAAVDSLNIPDIHIPHADEETFGSSVINAGADLADSGLQLALDGARSALSSGKEVLRTPVVALQTDAQDVAEFAQILQTHVQDATAQLAGHLAEFNAAVGRCQTGTDFVNVLIDQVSAITGTDIRTTLDGLLEAWNGVPALLDEAEAWANATFGPRSGTATEEPGIEVGEVLAAEPPPASDD